MFTELAAETLIDGRFRIIRLLGSGGLGAVYLVEQIDLGRTLALKIMHDSLAGDDDSEARFLREGRVLSDLSHPGIVSFYQFGLTRQRQAYIAMEFIEGLSARELQVREESLTWLQALNLTLKVAQAMAYAHGRGVVHRDLKPQNIILQGGNYREPKVIDFGLASCEAKAEGAKTLTATGLLIGSVHYMSPEQCFGKKADHRADIYSLACVSYELMAGVPPLNADESMGIIYKHTSEYPQPLSMRTLREKVPLEVDKVLFKAMAKDVEERYQTMDEFASHLGHLLSGRFEDLPANLALPNSVKIPSKSSQLHLFGIILLVLGLALVSFLCLSTLSSWRSAPVKTSTIDGDKPKPQVRYDLWSTEKLLSGILDKCQQGDPSAAELMLRQWKSSRFKRGSLKASDKARLAICQATVDRVLNRQDQAWEGLGHVLKELEKDPTASDADRMQILVNRALGNLSPAQSAQSTEALRSLVQTSKTLSNDAKAESCLTMGRALSSRSPREALTVLQAAQNYNRQGADLERISSQIKHTRAITLFRLGEDEAAREEIHQYNERQSEVVLHDSSGTNHQFKSALSHAEIAACAGFNDESLRELERCLRIPGIESKLRAVALREYARSLLRRWVPSGAPGRAFYDRKKDRQSFLRDMLKAKQSFLDAASIYHLQNPDAECGCLLEAMAVCLAMDDPQGAEFYVNKARVTVSERLPDQVRQILDSDLQRVSDQYAHMGYGEVGASIDKLANELAELKHVQ